MKIPLAMGAAAFVHHGGRARRRCASRVLLAGWCLLAASCSHKRAVVVDGSVPDSAPSDGLLQPDLELCTEPGLPGSWAVSVSGTQDVLGMGLGVDLAGNALITGKLRGEADFGGVQVRSEIGGYSAFFARVSSAGRFLWARAIGDAEGEYHVPAAAIDLSGRGVAAGSIDGAAHLGDTALAGKVGFVAVLDEVGRFGWVAQSAKTGVDFVAPDAEGNVFVVGGMHGRVTVDGVSRVEATLGPHTVFCAAGSRGGYAAKLARAGTFEWATPVCGDFVLVLRVVVDATGNAYVAGAFTDRMAVGEHSATAGDADWAGFVAKLDGQGHPTWLAPIVAEERASPPEVAVDAAGNVYVLGSVSGEASIGPHRFTPTGQEEAFLAKLDPDGGVAWVVQLSGHAVSGTGLVVTDAGRSLVALWTPDPVTVGGARYDAPRREQLLLLVFDPNGRPITGLRSGSPGVGPGRLRVDGQGNAYVLGQFRGPVCFGETELRASNQSLYFWKAGKVL